MRESGTLLLWFAMHAGPEREGGKVAAEGKVLEPIENPPLHLPWEEDNIKKAKEAYSNAHPHHTSTPEEEEGEWEEAEVERMECSSGVYTSGGCCCRIPFRYDGVEYTNCTLGKAARNFSYWCYVQEEGCGRLDHQSNQWSAPA